LLFRFFHRYFFLQRADKEYMRMNIDEISADFEALAAGSDGAGDLPPMKPSFDRLLGMLEAACDNRDDAAYAKIAGLLRVDSDVAVPRLFGAIESQLERLTDRRAKLASLSLGISTLADLRESFSDLEQKELRFRSLLTDLGDDELLELWSGVVSPHSGFDGFRLRTFINGLAPGAEDELVEDGGLSVDTPAWWENPDASMCILNIPSPVDLAALFSRLLEEGRSSGLLALDDFIVENPVPEMVSEIIRSVTNGEEEERLREILESRTAQAALLIDAHELGYSDGESVFSEGLFDTYPLHDTLRFELKLFRNMTERFITMIMEGSAGPFPVPEWETGETGFPGPELRRLVQAISEKAEHPRPLFRALEDAIFASGWYRMELESFRPGYGAAEADVSTVQELVVSRQAAEIAVTRRAAWKSLVERDRAEAAEIKALIAMKRPAIEEAYARRHPSLRNLHFLVDGERRREAAGQLLRVYAERKIAEEDEVEKIREESRRRIAELLALPREQGLVLQQLLQQDAEPEMALARSLFPGGPTEFGRLMEAAAQDDREREILLCQSFVFEDIILLDDRAIQKVLREIDMESLALAMKGVDPEVQEKITRNMSRRAAEMLREDMEYMGPVPRKDSLEKQDEVVRIILALEEAGEIVIPRSADDEVVF
jgi:hypothetical protein